jgi:hypothetical protein
MGVLTIERVSFCVHVIFPQCGFRSDPSWVTRGPSVLTGFGGLLCVLYSWASFVSCIFFSYASCIGIGSFFQGTYYSILVVLIWGWFCLSGHIWQCPEASWLSWLEWGCCWHLVESQDAAQSLTLRTALHSKELSSPKCQYSSGWETLVYFCLP